MLFKFYLTNKTKKLSNGIKLHRIVAARDFGNIKKGTLGGWVQYAENLSQFGDCWISDEATVCGDSVVSEDATIKDSAVVSGRSRVFGNADVRHNALLKGTVCVYDYAFVGFDSILTDCCSVSGTSSVICVSRRTNSGSHLSPNISGNAIIRGKSRIRGKADIRDNAIVEDIATVTELARIYEDAIVSGEARIAGQASVHGHAQILGLAIVKDRACLSGHVVLGGNMILSGRTFMTGWGIRHSGIEYRDKVISGDGTIVYDRNLARKMCFTTADY